MSWRPPYHDAVQHYCTRADGGGLGGRGLLLSNRTTNATVITATRPPTVAPTRAPTTFTPAPTGRHFQNKYAFGVDSLLLDSGKSICTGTTPAGADYVPPILWQTFWQTNSLPPKVYVNADKYAKTHAHKLCDNYDVDAILRAYFVPAVHYEYRRLKGPYRADVFRYAVLYLFGGVYLDIKTEMVMPLKWVFTRPNTTYTAIGAVGSERATYQGVLASPPCNPVFLVLIRGLMNGALSRAPVHAPVYRQRCASSSGVLPPPAFTSPPVRKPVTFHIFSPVQFYSLIAASVHNLTVTPGFHPNNFSIADINATATAAAVVADFAGIRDDQRKHFMDLMIDANNHSRGFSNFHYELFFESDDDLEACWDGADRYNMCSFIFARKAEGRKKLSCTGPGCTERVFKTRYADYPKAFGK